MAANAAKLGRRTTALLWIVGVGVIIGVLIYFELIAILYVLATIALVALLLIVGFSDLENVGREAAEVFIESVEIKD